jgi:predicted RNA-binding protein YlxR (DUF448 family)/ribosomal protein L30E
MYHIPIRQCVVCRSRVEKRKLIRIVKSVGSGIEVDRKQVVSGRGLYVCSSPECLKAFRYKDYMKNLWDIEPPPDFYTRLANTLKKDPNKELQGLLGFAIRAGHGVTGVTAIERYLKKKKIVLVVLDTDAGETTKKRINNICLHGNVPVFEYSGDRSLEDVIGKTNCRSIGIIDVQFARSIKKLF